MSPQSESLNHSCPNISLEFQTLLYAITNVLIFIPGLLANSIALWVLCSYINKKSKAVIFMINLAFADLAHVLTLPLRIFYYLNHNWPFGNGLCLLCFYLKYLNMYASIGFLVCISIQRCVFLISPFRAKSWKRRYDICISAALWVIVGAGCSPFVFLRNSTNKNQTCFADLPMKKPNLLVTATMVVAGDLTGFVIPFFTIMICSWKTWKTLKGDVFIHNKREKQKALRLVITCAVVFLICFAPYHLNFPLYVMSTTDVITNCETRKHILTFHPISLCLASLNCCLDPVIYYFMTTEFREQLSRHGSSIIRGRLMSKESGSSFKE
ncbi:putative P2Y purinoceptor 10 [Latimeria chalumnae]|nr:PREDICTED: putative P2Y purinoceptor 10 [Latimeria chalumnae]|eukprot:XP_006002263.1 PREDICTED: putative P2Y purinoceptor 10 [Latimeria chalumnae]